MNIKSISTLEKFKEELKFKNYSNRTIEIYIHYAYKFLCNFNYDLYHISQFKAIEFLKTFKYSSISQQNQFISSIKLLYKYVIKCELKAFNIERPRKEKHLPKIIDNDFILSKINSVINKKHKAILCIAYSVGLRVSEVINLKILDIDSKRMIITINNTKGKKDRIVPLTQKILDILREYYKQYKPKEYLFNGQNSLQYSAESCNKIVKKYLGENYHFHLLRHSCFTNLTNQGVDLRVIQKLAGHSSSKTTEIYTHVSIQLLNKLPLAL